MNLEQIKYVVGVLREKITSLGANPDERDCFVLLEEANGLTGLRIAVDRLNREAIEKFGVGLLSVS